MVAGDVLTATLTVDTLRQIGGADIIGTRSEITDADGAPVCTAYATLVHTGRCTNEPPRAGDELPTQTYTVTRADLVRYAGGERRLQPDPLVRPGRDRSVGLPGVIAHGMYTLALAARALDTWAGAPGRVRELGCKFTKPVVVPDDDDGVEVVVARHREERRRRRCPRSRSR